MFRVAFFVSALLLILTLSMGSTLHALVPHSHSHENGVDSMWQSLHSAMRGEEKKMLVAALSAFSVFAVAILVSQFSFAFFALRLSPIAVYGPPQLLESLRRGNLPYRKFT